MNSVQSQFTLDFFLFILPLGVLNKSHKTYLLRLAVQRISTLFLRGELDRWEGGEGTVFDVKMM